MEYGIPWNLLLCPMMVGPCSTVGLELHEAAAAAAAASCAAAWAATDVLFSAAPLIVGPELKVGIC